MKSKSEAIREILALGPVVPVLAFGDVEEAVETSRALVAGGLPVIEITLRTSAALECIRAVGKEVDGAIVGAGTVLNREMMDECVAAGSQFLVSPGATMELVDGSRKIDIPLLPGVSTPSEAMGLMAEGFDTLKFFPAEQSGGAAFLKSLSSVLPKLQFCPTGGITPKSAPTYLKLPNVACVGGSWVAPKELIAKKDWAGIQKCAAEAAALA